MYRHAIVSGVTVDQEHISYGVKFVSSSAVSTDVSSVDVMSRGYSASSSADTSGTQAADVLSWIDFSVMLVEM